MMLATMMMVLQAASGAAGAAPFDPHHMNRAEIKAHNAQLASTDPNYIRCKQELETGSLVKKRASCRTNAQWQAAWAVGNQDARDTAEAMQSKASSGSN